MQLIEPPAPNYAPFQAINPIGSHTLANRDILDHFVQQLNEKLCDCLSFFGFSLKRLVQH